jgi:hypothetical protein
MGALTIPARLLGSQLLSEFCPRCYWISLHFQNKLPFQIPFPGIFNSIDGYTKDLIHSYFDQHGKLPDWFPDIGNVAGYVPSRTLHYSKFSHEDPATRVILRGTPDDIFQLADGTFHIVDYKTAKATKTQDELFPLYEVQLNVYAYLGERLKRFRTIRLSLIYMEPQTDCGADELADLILDDGFGMRFAATPKEVTCQADRLIPPLLQRARTIYDRESPPRGKDNCRNCERLTELLKVLQP